MSERSAVTCPVCEQEFAVPEMQQAPAALAHVFGMSVTALTAMHQSLEAGRLERELDQHLSKHTPQQWLPVLVRYRHERDEARRALTALAMETDR